MSILMRTETEQHRFRERRRDGKGYRGNLKSHENKDGGRNRTGCVRPEGKKQGENRERKKKAMVNKRIIW